MKDEKRATAGLLRWGEGGRIIGGEIKSRSRTVNVKRWLAVPKWESNWRI